MYLYFYTCWRHHFSHPILSCACRTHIHKGLAQMASGRCSFLWIFVEIGMHQYSHRIALACLPVGLRRLWAAGGQGLCVPVPAPVFSAAHGPAAIYKCEGKEQGWTERTESRLGKWNGWQYTVDGDIRKLQEQPQSMSRNSSELCDWLLCARELCHVANNFWKSHSPNV